MGQISKFYKNKKVLITGHTGFKGTWLTVWLKSLGADICGFSQAPFDRDNFFDLSGIEQSILSINADIRNFNAINKAVQEFNPDIIIHLAAQALVKQSYKDPVETYSTNIMGTVNLLEAVRLNRNIKAVINVTSDKCYENQNWLRGYKESDPMGGYDPYSSSKGCSELITSAYARSFFGSVSKGVDSNTALASARSGNVIGGGDFSENRLIPDMVRAFLKKQRVHIRYPHAVRPWQHVLEPLAGYMLLALKLTENGSRYNGAWNFGPNPDGAREVGYIVDKFISFMGGDHEWAADFEKHPHEAGLLTLDCSKVKNQLGWEAKLNIDQALEWTANWYKVFQDEPQRVLETTEKQINSYETLLK
ncbi:MAG: CDP-glucose 4,6-dehydratase [Desulfobacula sp.]|nr:CDP-glucose 4,6-dehydratase [Desulfobacula sp.]